MEINAVLTRKEAAKFLKISLPSLDICVKRGLIQKVKIGKRVLFRPETLQNFVVRCEGKGRLQRKK